MLTCEAWHALAVISERIGGLHAKTSVLTEAVSARADLGLAAATGEAGQACARICDHTRLRSQAAVETRLRLAVVHHHLAVLTSHAELALTRVRLAYETHTPAFWHGDEPHGSMSVWQFWPV